MATREIIWSKQSIEDRIQILDFWYNKNKSIDYSLKLDLLFIKSAEKIKAHPFSFKKLLNTNYRIKIIRNYHLIFEIIDETIFIITIWDSRQDPNKIYLKI